VYKGLEVSLHAVEVLFHTLKACELTSKPLNTKISTLSEVLYHTSDNIDILGICSYGMLCSVGWKLAIDALEQDGTDMLSLNVVYQLPT
jgi:hypothetical protein